MNLVKLFEVQKVLRDRINYNEPDRFNKLVLALLVELGECANCWRGFKFWSKNQEPKRFEEEFNLKTNRFRSFDPLLEEYVDGLHFVLELGIEIGETNFQPTRLISFIGDITGAFNSLYRLISELNEITLLVSPKDYRVLFNNYLSLGEQLGFTWEEIEQAYMEKNKVNHQRQESGY